MVDLGIVECLQVHPKYFQTGRRVAVMVDEVQVVLPKLFLAEIVHLDRTHGGFSGHDSTYQSGANTASADRVGEPCSVSAVPVAVGDVAVVLVSNRDLPRPREVAVITQRLNVFESIIGCQPIFQECAERLWTSLLLDTQANVDLVFGFWKEPEITARCLFRIE